jgi:hypothetical protein
VLVVSIHQATMPERRVWSHIAVAFATVYAVLISLVYFVQLTWVGPRLARGQAEGLDVFRFVPFDSFLYAVDILGYSFMSLATLFAAMVFTGNGIERIVRWFLVANGLMLPFIALQMYFHPLIWIAALWAVTFPGSAWSLAVLFKRAPTLVASPRLCGVLVLASIMAAGTADAQVKPGPSVEFAAGWVGFPDDGLVSEGLVGGQGRWYLTPRVSVGPEVAYIGGQNHSHLVVTGNLTWDLRGAVAGREPPVTAGSLPASTRASGGRRTFA